MGNLRFEVSNPQRLDGRIWQTAYITGMEGIAWQCYHQTQGDQFIIGRQLDESGKLNIVWPTRPHGNLCLSTGSLKVSEVPYPLTVEIARGTVGRLKNQTAEWQRMGLRLPDGYFSLAESGQRNFLRSVTTIGDPDKRDSLAQSAIDFSIQASSILANSFSEQALLSRHQTEGTLTTLLGATLPRSAGVGALPAQLPQFINAVNIRADLGSVEQHSGQMNFEPLDVQLKWAVEQQLELCVGPLIDFRTDRLPPWMILLDEDYFGIMRAACQHAQKTVERYRGQVHIWNCAAGLNSPNRLRWGDEQALRMAVAIIETVRNADKHTPVLLTIEQPWGEYLRDHADGISPFHFADALIRADLGLSGLALELNLDHWPGGSLPRDLIDINRLVDRWSMLGLPLLIYLTSPTQAAIGKDHRVADWATGTSASWSDSPANLGFVLPENIVQLLVSKPSIHAIVWDQLVDQPDGALDCKGMFFNSGAPKPLASHMSNLRKRFLR
ncbi:MAG: hypothetical protein KF752_18380 [Pirellulaceae bacterium]|nr:hypothetical protein [Pirellulaceae bacterium]